MPKINLSESALHDWVHTLTFQQQALLMTGMRGPDGCNKRNPAKGLIRFLRGAICKPAGNWDGSNNNDFMWGDYSAFETQMNGFFEDPDGYPHHFIMHLIHCAEVIAYKHPSIRVRQYWLSFYLGSCVAFHMTPETRQHMDDRLNDFGVGPSSHPAPAPIVGEREERKYPIGGYAPGNYHCNCVTCKQHFKGDKRAVQCEPCAIKAEDSAPTDQALPEEVEQWVKNWIDTNIPPIAFPEYNSQLATRQKAAEAIAIALYHKMQEDLRAATIIHEQTGNALQAQLAEAKQALRIASQNETSYRVWLEKSREGLSSARTLILNIKRGNIYQEPADECDKWLTDNIETK